MKISALSLKLQPNAIPSQIVVLLLEKEKAPINLNPLCSVMSPKKVGKAQVKKNHSPKV